VSKPGGKSTIKQETTWPSITTSKQCLRKKKEIIINPDLVQKNKHKPPVTQSNKGAGGQKQNKNNNQIKIGNRSSIVWWQ